MKFLFIVASAGLAFYFLIRLCDPKKEPTRNLIAITIITETTLLYLLFPFLVGNVHWIIALAGSLFVASLATFRAVDLRDYFRPKEDKER